DPSLDAGEHLGGDDRPALGHAPDAALHLPAMEPCHAPAALQHVGVGGAGCLGIAVVGDDCRMPGEPAAGVAEPGVETAIFAYQQVVTEKPEAVEERALIGGAVGADCI